VKITEQWRMVKGSTIVSVFLWDAIHRASGKPFSLEIAAIYEYNKDGKRQNVRYFYDTAKFKDFLSEVNKTATE
jgi:hypothetical protein